MVRIGFPHRIEAAFKTAEEIHSHVALVGGRYAIIQARFRKEFIDADKNAAGFEKEMKNLAQSHHTLDDVKKTYNCWVG